MSALAEKFRKKKGFDKAKQVDVSLAEVWKFGLELATRYELRSPKILLLACLHALRQHAHLWPPSTTPETTSSAPFAPC